MLVSTLKELLKEPDKIYGLSRIKWVMSGAIYMAIYIQRVAEKVSGSVQ